LWPQIVNLHLCQKNESSRPALHTIGRHRRGNSIGRESPATMTRLVLIRHGETDWNVEGRYQGQADPPLNARGIAQARRLAHDLAGAGIDVLYSSPLKRALETARILAQTLHVPLYTDPRLMEIHQGKWEGRLRSEIVEQYPILFQQWLTDPWTVSPPGGESLRDVQARVYAAVEEIVARHRGQTIGLVTHRIPIALLKVRYQGMELDIVRTLELPNTYWEEIVLRDNGPAEQSSKESTANEPDHERE